MQTGIKWRLGVIVAVVAISIWLITPTMVYFVSLSDKVAATPERLEELRLQSVPLGLDLQGGVDVLLAVDEAKTRQNKVQGFVDDLTSDFRQESPAIDANVEMTSGAETITITVNRAEQARSVENILAKRQQNGIFSQVPTAIEAGKPFTVTVDPNTLKQDISETVKSALTVIRERVNKLGVTQPVVIQQGETRIRVQVPGEKNPDRVISEVIRPARLEFRGVSTSSQSYTDSDGKERFPENSQDFINIETGEVLPGKSIPPGYEKRIMRVTSTNKETNQLETNDRYILVKKKVEMTGEDLQNAYAFVDQTSFSGQNQVVVEFKPKGAKRFGDVTAQYVNKPLAMLLDDVVYSAPNVNEEITGGRCNITGGFSLEEARNLSMVLKAGALPAELSTKEKRTVEASLGADSIKSSVFALAIGSLLVAIYMIAYYGTAGVISMLAVLINVMIIFAFMKLMSATLTLSGIGGILLTVGMAVDANVLIYERIREELHGGKSLRTSINLGFGRAFGVIFDANLTTLISGLVMLQFGSGSVKGFALSLNIGILATLFTGLFVTQTLIEAYYLWRKKISLGRLMWFKPGWYLDFIGLRKYSYTLSIILLVICVLWVLPFKPFPGSNWGVDFTGGVLVDVESVEDVNVQKLQEEFPEWRLQKVAGQNKFIVRAKLASEGAEEIPKTVAEVETGLTQALGAGKFTIKGSEAVSNEVGGEFTQKAMIAVLIASIGILGYMAFRFEFAFGLAAVLALFHDVLITFGLFNILGYFGFAGEVTLDVVAALLVILGYSVNDTIIIFDRVRENMKLHPSMPFCQMINHSICDSMNRTIMTVSTVLVVLLVMMLIGGVGLFDFALVLFIGIVKGTYSSSLVASPLLYELHERAKRQGKTIVRQTEDTSKAARPIV